MTVNECFICPVCGSEHSALTSAAPLLSDVRVDTLVCTECNAEWRIYFKVAELQREVTQRRVSSQTNEVITE